MLLREGCQGSEFADAGIGDQDIDLSLGLHGLVESIEVRQFGDVPANTCNVAADRLHGLVELLLAATRYEDVGAFVDEALRRGETYSRGAAGNHGEVSLQLAHSRHSSGVRSPGLPGASARCLTIEPTADVLDRVLIEAAGKAPGDGADMRRGRQ